MSTHQFKRKSQVVQQLLSQVADELSRPTGFVRRASKLTGAVFAQSFILGCLDQPDASLNQLVQYADQCGVHISEAGLQQRIQPCAVALLLALLDYSLHTLREQPRLPLKVLAPFSAVNLIDASTITLPETLRSVFPGGQTVAAAKVTLSFDYLHTQLKAVALTAARQPDQQCPLVVAGAEAGSLQVFDLGFFDQQTFAQLEAAQAFFLSRLQAQTALYLTAEQQQPLDLVGYLLHLPLPQTELSVWLGQQARLSVRLLIERLPNAVVAERRRKAKVQARRRGKTCSQRHLTLLQWALFVTNVPHSWLTLEQAIQLYRVRWQIELLFKLCKSQLHLDVVRQWSAARFQCQLYARLIGLVLFHWLVAPVCLIGEREVSFPKALTILRRYSHRLLEGLSHRPAALAPVLAQLAHDFVRFARKDQRTKSPTTYQRLLALGGLT